jgi:hypothetical protein
MSIPMDDYEVRDVMNRSHKPVLTVDGEILKARPQWLTDFRMMITGSAPVRIPSFDLRLWLTNSGGITAKHTQIILSFENLMIKKVHGLALRIDDIRNGKPSLQWGSLDGVIHPKTQY